MAIFLDSGDYRQFAYLLGEVCDDGEIECWSYCLMPNHYHAVLRPQRPNVSEAIRYLNSEYAKWWNRKHQRVGHTFQGRFKDQIVEHDGYLLTLLRYVALNPVRAGLVGSPTEWRWGSYPALAGIEPPPRFLSQTQALSAFGDGELDVLRARFVSHVLQQKPDEDATEDRIRSNERVLGSGPFKKCVSRWKPEDGPLTVLDGAMDGVDGVRPDSDPTQTPV